MALARLVFEIPRVGSFAYDKEGAFHAASTPELEILLLQCQQAAERLKVYLTSRRPEAQRQEEGTMHLHQALTETAGEISRRRLLEGKKVTRVEEAMRIVDTEQSDYRAKRYSRFLQTVLRQFGRGMFIICASSLSQKQVSENNEQTRSSLLSFIQSEKESLDSAHLQELAARLRFPSDDQCLSPPPEIGAYPASGRNQDEASSREAIEALLALSKDARARINDIKDSFWPLASVEVNSMDEYGPGWQSSFRDRIYSVRKNRALTCVLPPSTWGLIPHPERQKSVLLSIPTSSSRGFFSIPIDHECAVAFLVNNSQLFDPNQL